MSQEAGNVREVNAKAKKFERSIEHLDEVADMVQELYHKIVNGE